MTLDHKIRKPVSIVFDYLTNMQKFVSIHPIIYKMDDLGDNNYKVYEKLKFFFIPCSFTYYATVFGNSETKTVNIKAVVMKMTHIEMNFIIKEENEYSHVRETVTFRSPLPLKGVMETIFEKQHKQLFLNIEEV